MAKAKQIIGIDCDGPAHLAIAQVLNTRMGEMCAFREYVLESRDPEGVHDMRVASRRLRTALRDFTPYLEKKRFADSLENMKALAQSLGSVRDHDVAIITLKTTATEAPPEISDGILRLVELRHRARERAFAELAPALKSDGLSRLMAKFEGALHVTIKRAHGKGVSRQSAPLAPCMTYREVTRSTILGHLKDLEERSQSLYRPSEAKPLHKVRITAKRLRYALELFDQCWQGKTKPFAKKLSALQSALGDLHDCDVWINSIGDELIKDSVVSHDAGSAWLLSHLVNLRTKHFRKALRHWTDWESDGLSLQLRTIFLSHQVEPLNRHAPKSHPY